MRLLLLALSLLVAICAYPAQQTAIVGQTVTISYTADGTPPLVPKWQKNSQDIPGATNQTLVFSPVQLTDAGTYSVIISNSAGSTTSDNAILTVIAANVIPTFTIQPANQTVLAGSPVTFSTIASGVPTPTYQWRKNGTNIVGATATDLTILVTSVDDAGTYTVVATNSVGSATSSGATLVVNPVITPPTKAVTTFSVK